MKKIGLYLTIIISVFILTIYFLKLRKIDSDYGAKNFKFSIPKVLFIKEKVEKDSYVGNPVVWGLKGYNKQDLVSSLLKQKKGNLNKVGFVYKNIKGIPSLCKISNKKYRWEFYGTVYKRKVIMAIFYNPTIKKNKVRLLRKGSILDKGLFIKNIKNNYVEVDYVNKNRKKEIFKLMIFKINKRLLKGG